MISNVKIIICDDSLMVRKTLSDMLHKIGVKDVYEAVDGNEGIEKYKNYKPDIVFMDIVMPGKTGIETLKEIKDYDSSANVVIVSSALTQKYMTEAIKAGAKEFIQKPFSVTQIQKIIDKL